MMRQRHTVLILLVLLGLITFLDRLCIAVTGPRIQQELGISPSMWGWVLSAFILSYGLFEIPTGALGDRIGQRRVLTRVVLWWSAFTSLTGAVSSFPALVAVRFLFGIGEAGAYPNISGSIARWFPVTERARTQGYVWAASRMGGALAPLLVVPIQQAYGWRAAFWIFGSVGFAWAAAWWFIYRDDPREHPRITRQELDEIAAGAAVRPAGSAHAAPGSILHSRQLWLLVTMYWCQAWGSWFFFSWMHTYLVKARGFTESEMGIFSALPFVMSAAGNLTGGYLSDLMVRKHGLSIGRRVVSCAGLATGAALILATALSTGKTSAIVLLTLGFGIMDLMLPSAWAICLDIGRENAGVVAGAMNMSGQFGGFVCTILFGYVVEATGNYNAPLFLIAAMVATAAVLFGWIDASRPLIPRNETASAP